MDNVNLIRGDVAKYEVGQVGTVSFSSGDVYQNVKIKRIVQSKCDGYVDDYYVIDLPERENCWVCVYEFEAA